MAVTVQETQCVSYNYGRVSTTVVYICRLARFRGLMMRGKYGAVIGRKSPLFCMCPVFVSRLWVISSQSERRNFPSSPNQGYSPNDRCKLQWMTPPIDSSRFFPLSSFYHVYENVYGQDTPAESVATYPKSVTLNHEP
jgi:hypothetical protein